MALRIVVFEPGLAPRLTEIDKTLEAMRAVIGGGWVASARLFGSIWIYHDDDGLLRNLPPCVRSERYGVMVGPCFALALDDEGDERSLTDDEIAEVLRVVEPVEARPKVEA